MVHHDSTQFDLDGKTQMNLRKSSISKVCKGSIRVSYGVCTVSVWFFYKFTIVYVCVMLLFYVPGKHLRSCGDNQ